MTGTPVFLPAHASALMAYISSVDSRFTEVSEEVAAARLRAWTSILSDVDPAFALAHARRFYSRARPDRITPGEIRTAWMTQQRREAARTRPPLPAGTPAPTGLRDYLNAVLAAVQAGRDPATVPVPAGKSITPEAELASRRCEHWRDCACDHTTCRAGWLDNEVEVKSVHGLAYRAVEPCPHCRDAALMAAERATPVRGRR